MVSLSLVSSRGANLVTLQLKKINKELQKTQLRITTGLRINGPQDDPASFHISTKLRGEKIFSVA